jgi:benzoyl-CoA reductase/2-hydroxyglutaryl-CoA dehydratase subunit BcrC/BadD/HgdB
VDSFPNQRPDADGPLVGYLCTTTPPEVILAAGGVPFRMTGDGRNPEAAERLAHPNLCGLCKSALAWAMTVPGDRPVLAAIAGSCDGCRRLAPILRGLPGVAGALAFDLPRTTTEADALHFAAELRGLHAALCARTGAEATEGALRAAIRDCNAARAAVREAIDAATAGRLPIRAAFDAAEAFLTRSPGEAARVAGDLLRDAKDAKAGRRPGVVLAGNLTLGPGLAEAIERAGARVVALDLCNVERAVRIAVAERGDPYEALARAVLSGGLCPRFEPGIDWAERLADRAAKTGARGVVLASLKFCDNTLYAYPSARALLEGRGLSVLTLETDYVADVPGQVATRIEAFMEML